MMPATTIFHFLETDFPILANLGKSAENYLFQDAPVAAIKLRTFAEKLTEIIFKENRISFPRENTLAGRISELRFLDVLPDNIGDLLMIIKNAGNAAAHGSLRFKSEDAKVSLESTFKVARWFQETYGSADFDWQKIHFAILAPVDPIHQIKELEIQFKTLESRFDILLSEKKAIEQALLEEQKRQTQERSKKAARSIRLNEVETRFIIDEKLRNAGWETDTASINYKLKGTLPEKGRNLAIAEWPCGERWADYALFIGTKLIALIEAKSLSKDVYSDLGQAKNYAEKLSHIPGIELEGIWDNYKVPFLFSTNGREYHPQLEQASGIWFHDIRRPTNHPKVLQQWFSPQGLSDMLVDNPDLASEKLNAEPFDYLQDSIEGLGLRTYQVDAIRAVENSILSGNNRALVAMATGTGKTRTIVGLVYRLLKTHCFRRILFLVDRNLLGKQAKDNFTEFKVEEFQTFASIYSILGFENAAEKQKEERQLIGKSDSTVKVHFATVQSMVRRIYDNAHAEDIPSPNTYDCIIVDEAHRGYLLDREMDEDQVVFRNYMDFVSKYSQVLQYFHAFKIGMTATPAPHTTDIFGPPVFEYTYRQAVIDGYLIDHEPPILIKTKLSEQGIRWEKGEKPLIKKSETGEILELEQLEDELRIDIEGFNKQVITEPFNLTVCKELVNFLDPESQQKTLIFAATDEHADMVVRLMLLAFEEAGIETDHRAVKKITGRTDKVNDAVSNFKNERYPSIAVTVDLLTTGVDVPSICNLVFLRRINSRILYEQMLGRATRRCDEIGKEVFRIFDAVRLYEAMQDFSNMKPVTPNPSQTFTDAAEAIVQSTTDGGFERAKQELQAKLQRKKGLLHDPINLQKFLEKSAGIEIHELIQQLKKLEPSEAQEFKNLYSAVFDWLEDIKPPVKYPYVAQHADELQDISHGYGKGQKPEDYLASFRQYILENQNRLAALNIVCTRPRDLTRAELKNLRSELDRAGFSVVALNTAVRETRNNVDLTADIIAHIRAQALGNNLESQEERVGRAMKKIYDLRNWNAVQRKWLERIEKQLLRESIINSTVLDEEPFRKDGGYMRLNRIFQGEMDLVIQQINQQLYAESA
jgi:type I restriction enzyme R subunit